MEYFIKFGSVISVVMVLPNFASDLLEKPPNFSKLTVNSGALKRIGYWDDNYYRPDQDRNMLGRPPYTVFIGGLPKNDESDTEDYKLAA